jgi:hypothetical protein
MAGPVHQESLAEQLEHAITESRMVLPGVQAILGFQLIAVFNGRFERDLSSFEHALHAAAFLLVAIATCLLMTPAAYHRIAQRRSVDPQFIALASRLLAIAMLPLATGLSLDAFLVFRLALQDRIGAGVLAGMLFCLFGSIWYVYPSWARLRHERAITDGSANAASPAPPPPPPPPPAMPRARAN